MDCSKSQSPLSVILVDTTPSPRTNQRRKLPPIALLSYSFEHGSAFLATSRTRDSVSQLKQKSVSIRHVTFHFHFRTLFLHDNRVPATSLLFCNCYIRDKEDKEHCIVVIVWKGADSLRNCLGSTQIHKMQFDYWYKWVGHVNGFWTEQTGEAMLLFCPHCRKSLGIAGVKHQSSSYNAFPSSTIFQETTIHNPMQFFNVRVISCNFPISSCGGATRRSRERS